MDDLISRQALLAEYDRLHVGEPGRARKLIEDAPSAQLEIIRCKDCRYYKTYQYVNGIRKFLPKCSFNNIYVAEEDFCSQAERRQDG